jgi:hypothetical protein
MSVIESNVVSITTNPILRIANSIKNGTRTEIEEGVDLLQFMKEIEPGKFILNEDKTLQVRGTLLDYKFVEGKMNSVINNAAKGIDYIHKMPVLVYFSQKVEYEGTVFPNNSYAILDRNHGAVIQVWCGVKTSDCYTVNFDTDLSSSFANVRRLGNLLNYQKEEAQPLLPEHIQTEYHAKMDEVGGKLSDAQNQEFRDLYPLLGSGSLRNFSGNHSTGGRTKTVKTWTPLELDKQTMEYKSKYKDWLVMSPRTCGSWKGEASGQATWDVLNEVFEDQKKKILFIFYARNKAQAAEEYQADLRKQFARWAEEYKFIVELIFLRSK